MNQTTSCRRVLRDWNTASSSSSAQYSLQKYPPVDERHASTRPFTNGNGCLQCAQWVLTPPMSGGLDVEPMVVMITPDLVWTHQSKQLNSYFSGAQFEELWSVAANLQSARRITRNSQYLIEHTAVPLYSCG
jgi:hypothetical protein